MRFIGTGKVWNGKINKVDIIFTDGFYDTFDDDEIIRLRASGFKEEITAADLEEARSTDDKDDLRKEALSLGCAAESTIKRWGITRLKKEIEKALEA